MKICTKCKLEKPIEAFYRTSTSSRGKATHWTQCKVCVRQYQNAYLARNRRPYDQDTFRKHRYGMAPGDYDKLETSQEGKCAICGLECDLVINHDHKTKVVRGLLCTRCKTGIGFLADDPEICRSAADYLAKQFRQEF